MNYKFLRFLFSSRFSDDFERDLLNFEAMYRTPGPDIEAFTQFLMSNLTPEDIIVISRLGRILEGIFGEM